MFNPDSVKWEEVVTSKRCDQWYRRGFHPDKRCTHDATWHLRGQNLCDYHMKKKPAALRAQAIKITEVPHA